MWPLWDDSCTLVSYSAAFWAIYDAPCLVTLHPWATLLSYTLRRTELPCSLLSFTASFLPSELHCTLWAMLHPTEMRLHSIELEHALMSYTSPCRAKVQPAVLTSLSPYWAMLYPSELAAPAEQCCTLLSRGTLLSYAAPYWATLYPPSCAAPYWAKLNPAELHSTHLWASSP